MPRNRRVNFAMDHLRFTLAIVLTCVLFQTAAGQVVEEETEDGSLYRLSVSPASPEPPLLGNVLLPPLLQQQPGNAAPLYYRAILLVTSDQLGQEEKTKLWEKISEWQTMPLDELPEDEVEQTFARFNSALEETSRAARRTECDWNFPIREAGSDIFSILLPEIQEMRNLARLVVVRIRLRLKQGRMDDALHDMRTGFAMARHTGNDGFIINALVGVAVSHVVRGTVLEAIALEESPNMYWPLTALPDPIVDTRLALDREYNAAFIVFPQMLEAQHDEGDEELWNHKLREAIRNYGRTDLSGNSNDRSISVEKIMTRLAILSQIPRVKRQLVTEMGWDQAEVDAMPGSRALLLYSGLRLERMRDSLYAPAYLPYYQAKEQYKKVRIEGQDVTQGDPLNVDSLLLPALDGFHRAVAKSQRWTAMLRAVESVRDHAQLHGKLPESLDEVRLPIPLDPLTGKAFEYQLAAEDPRTFILTGPLVATRDRVTLQVTVQDVTAKASKQNQRE